MKKKVIKAVKVEPRPSLWGTNIRDSVLKTKHISVDMRGNHIVEV